MLGRKNIEGRAAQDFVADLSAAFDRYCAGRGVAGQPGGSRSDCVFLSRREPPGWLASSMTLPPDFRSAADEAWERVRVAPGFLTEREARFLALAAACTPGQGVILEIGSFKGKSTVGLASIVARYSHGKVVAVDPHTAPSSTDPSLGDQSSSFDDFLQTLARAEIGRASCR